MKTIIVLFLVALFLPACLTTPPGEEARPELDGLMEHWINAFKSENAAAMLEAYWPEAEVVIIEPDGRERVLRGHEQILRSNSESFERLDVFRELRYSPPEREFRGEAVIYHYRVEAPQLVMAEHFEFSRRDGRWRIIHQVIDTRAGSGPQDRAPQRPPAEGPPRVASDFQAWADTNRNGLLEPPELRQLLEAVQALVREPHPVRSPADRFFDRNGDGEIDPQETMEARNLIFLEQPRRLYTYDRDLARIFDLDGNEHLSFWELMGFMELPFWPELREPRRAEDPFAQRADKNRDGFADGAELEQLAGTVLTIVSILPLDPANARREVRSRQDVLAYLDLNGNGRLEGPEEEDLVFVFQEAAGVEPGHPVRTALEDYYDRNRDGRLHQAEIEQLRVHFMEAVRGRLLELEPELAREYIDRNRNNRLEDEEIGSVLGRVLSDPHFREPRRVEGPLDERLDSNRDGRVSGEELHQFHFRLLRAVALSWLEAPAAREERWAVASVLDELADLDGNGFVDPGEYRLVRESLTGPHRVENELDRRIDFNQNGDVDALEIMRARRAGNVAAVRGEEPAGALRAATVIDGFIDLNGDRQVTEEEIQKVVRYLFRPEQAPLPDKWRELLDLDRNGRISQDEIRAGWEMYLRPHPVNPAFRLDSRLDSNRDGFVEPEEIGIAAGIAIGRSVATFDERLEQLGWQEQRSAEGRPAEPRPAEGRAVEGRAVEREVTRKLDLVQDKKLAVVGIESGTRNVDQETAGGVMVFIENAFVNVGKVRVVDRQNINKILSEHEFQQSDLTDESTAVKIGRLSGAEIIVIGTISFVGQQYYLNIKLISVETGEIIGSSISAAEEASGFYEMCNEAVYKLF